MYRLPDGSATRSKTKYVDAWRAFAQPFEDAGLVLHSFDPGIAFTSPEHPMAGIVSLPIWAAKKLRAAVTQQGNNHD